MTSILTLVARAAEIARAPRCSDCGDVTDYVSEELVAGTPPVLETVFRCRGCGRDLVRCLVATAID
jgi:hypothetical protein